MDRTVLRIANLKHTEKNVSFFSKDFLNLCRIDIQLSILFFPFELFIMIYVHTLRSEYKKERQIEFVCVECECALIQTKRGDKFKKLLQVLLIKMTITHLI